MYTMPEVENKAWYTEWFNSPYYDLLYKERDQEEAENFIKKLVAFLSPKPGCLMLDIACGKGRHAISLSKMGFTIDGFDLSEKNILCAKNYETPTLSFYIHDMRRPFMVNYYDTVFNLFTSFGYFENERENQAVLVNIYNALKPGGIFVLDFMNMEKTLQHILAHEEKIVDGVKFQVSKSIDKNSFLVKEIHVEDKKAQYDFEEKVKTFTQATLKNSLIKCGFEIIRIFGDYLLNDFNPATSDRLILISKKKQ
jgi:SAM-dependent methyltransferase